MIYVSCQFETPIGRSDYSDYVRALQIDISGCDANGDRVLLGKIAADQVLLGDAQVDGMPLFDFAIKILRGCMKPTWHCSMKLESFRVNSISMIMRTH